MKLFKPNAYTLVEVMITMTIFTVMMASIYTTLFLSQRAWNNYAANIVPRNEVRRAFNSLTEEIREAENIFITKEKNSITIEFDRSMIGHVIYEWSSEGENAGKIVRVNYMQKNVLANGIKEFNVIQHTDRELFIEVKSGEKRIFTLKQQIALRMKTGLIAQSANEKIK